MIVRAGGTIDDVIVLHSARRRIARGLAMLKNRQCWVGNTPSLLSNENKPCTIY